MKHAYIFDIYTITQAHIDTQIYHIRVVCKTRNRVVVAP
jgi:hypothetical protein